VSVTRFTSGFAQAMSLFQVCLFYRLKVQNIREGCACQCSRARSLMSNPRLLNEFEAARELNLSIQTFNAICDTRRVPCIKYGQLKFFKADEIQAIKRTFSSEHYRRSALDSGQWLHKG
jgi:hypothetical protein